MNSERSTEEGPIMNFADLSSSVRRETGLKLKWPIALFACLSLALAATPAYAVPCANESLRAENNSLALPDCRAYEQVSPAGNAEVYVPEGSILRQEDALTPRPFRSSYNGEAVAYLAAPPSSGEGGSGSTAGQGFGDQYLAGRAAGAWAATDIQPLSHQPGTGYQAFSSNLSAGILYAENIEGIDPPLTPEAPVPCNFLYSRTTADGGYHALFGATARRNLGAFACGFRPTFVGASVDGSQQFFQTDAALTPSAEEELRFSEQGEGNLYDSAGGSLHQVNILPGGEPEPAPNATFGGPSGTEARPDLSGAVSTDGSRVFWTALGTEKVYVRENADQEQSQFAGGHCVEPVKACTVPVSTSAAKFWTASPDGRFAYYTENGELWRFDVTSNTREALAGAGAEVEGVVGVNETGEDGSYVYFVAAGALASGAAPLTCAAPEPESREEEEEAGELPASVGCNLYLRHAGVTKYIRALSPRDDRLEAAPGSGGYVSGDWQPNLGARTAQITRDGRHLLFTTHLPLTGYDNQLSTSNGLRFEAELFIYDADTEELSCASCAPSGAPPSLQIGEGGARKLGEGTFAPISLSMTYTRRLISSDGSRVFFDSIQSLLPQKDTNGVQDVYEWERRGASSCAEGSVVNGGCLSLLSDGRSTGFSYLADASASGADVFLTTRARLIVGDGDEKPDLYDARVDGGLPRSQEPTTCAGDACRGLLSSPPAFDAPGSATFSGAGNAVSPAPAIPPKPVTKCANGKRTSHNKCVTVKRKCSKGRKARRGKCDRVKKKCSKGKKTSHDKCVEARTNRLTTKGKKASNNRRGKG
jgi:hypothetical protein